MVMPFLTSYLNENFSFNFTEIGWMMASIGFGSLFGNWIGGKLTDRIGFYTVMLCSLLLTGFGIIAIMFLYDFTEVCIGLFIITAIADMYKPAMYVAVLNFSKKDNRTRALTLVRLAANLGIISGPVLAGLLIQKNNYDLLFWIDGISCLVAISVFMLLIDESKFYQARKKVYRNRAAKLLIKEKISTDTNYILFLFASFLTAFLFFQLFTTIPLYNSQKLNLTQLQIGLILSLNGLIIFLFEMPMIGFLEKKNIESTKIILLGSVFMASGFLCILFSKSIVILIISIALITAGQILLFSFSNIFALSRAIKGKEGQYMAHYAMSFSAAQILSPKISFTIIDHFSYFSNWLFMVIIGLIGIWMYYKLDKNIRIESHNKDLKKVNIS